MARRVLTPDGAFCAACGTAVEAGAQLCFSCGQPFEGEGPGVKCPQCGRVVDEEEAKCPTCGTTLPKITAETPAAKDLILQLKAFREQGRAEVQKIETVPSAMPEDTEQSLLAELESLWKLSEPFEQVVTRRRQRLEQMDRLIASARRRVRELEESNSPAEAREREELKKQVQEVLLERDEILKIEYGITEMERIYRNIITMQQKELRSKEDALRARLEGFRKEIGMRDAERAQLAERERELGERERDLQAKIDKLEGRLREVESAPRLTLPAPPPREPPQNEMGGVTREQWLAAQKEIQESLMKLRGTEGEIVLPTATNVRDLRVRVNELEESFEKITEERNRLQSELEGLQAADEHVREVLKEIDDLLGKLPDAEIKKFARSAAYKRYEELMERLGL